MVEVESHCYQTSKYHDSIEIMLLKQIKGTNLVGRTLILMGNFFLVPLVPFIQKGVGFDGQSENKNKKCWKLYAEGCYYLQETITTLKKIIQRP